MNTKACTHPNCSHAGNPQSIDQFSKDRTRVDGKHPYCKTCRTNYARERMKRPEAKQKAKEADKRYRNSEHGKRHIKEYYTSPEYRKRANEYAREYGKRPAEKLRRAMKQARYRTRNVLKEKARHVVGYALKSGKLQKPDYCEWCLESAKEEQLESHHWRGYDTNHWLDVKFIHPKCHDICEILIWE